MGNKVQSKQIKYYIVIGSSRGLGAAMVEELLKNEFYQVIGVARTKLEDVKTHKEWIATKRYRHVVLDIASSECSEILKGLCAYFSDVPICVIFNAACIKQDVTPDHFVDIKASKENNCVGINGLGYILKAFEGHFFKNGGLLVGISSVWGMTPPLSLPWMAYPATKAYLDMTMRCLRIFWKKKVDVVTIHLGHLDNSGASRLPRWLSPTYPMTAKKIIRAISGKQAPRDMYCPSIYRIFYNYLFRIVPDSLFIWLFTVLYRFAKTAEHRNS